MSRARIRMPVPRALAAILWVLAFAVPALATEPVKDPDLQRLSAQMAQLDADPSLGQLGGADRVKARQALAELAQTGPRSRERPPVLYIAERRVAAAQFAAQADLAEREIEQLDHEHDRILLEASRRDADQARREAERLRLQNSVREEEAQRAQAEREMQNQQAADIASDESDQARALAEARAKEAALAQQEAALAGGKPVSAPPGSSAAEPRGRSMSIADAAFAPGTASLRTDAATKARIKALVAFANSSAGATIRIEGHTDNRGNAQTNLSLSQRRADAIRNALRTAGVPGNRIQAVGLGGEQPLASNATAKGREVNRRVEVVLLRKDR